MYSHYVSHAGRRSMTIMPNVQSIDEVLQTALCAAQIQAEKIAAGETPKPEMHRAFKQGPPYPTGDGRPSEQFYVAFEVNSGKVTCRDCASFPTYFNFM